MIHVGLGVRDQLALQSQPVGSRVRDPLVLESGTSWSRRQEPVGFGGFEPHLFLGEAYGVTEF